jgi:hypothetical protein
MEPFNYSINAPNPNTVFQQAFQTGNLMRQSQEAAQAQQMQRDQAQRMAAALGQLGPNATPADYQGLINQFPDLVKPLTERYQGFDDARKNALFGAGQQAFLLLRPGADGAIDAEAAASSLERSAAAFQNSNALDIAKQLTDAAKGVRMNPGAAKQSLGMMLAFSDPDRFKKVGDAIGQGELTGFQKDLAAAGIDPKSPEGIAASKGYVRNRVDPIVTMETPNGRQFIGPQSVYMERFGAGAGAPQRLPTISTDAQFDALPSGAQFLDPRGNVRRKP